MPTGESQFADLQCQADGRPSGPFSPVEARPKFGFENGFDLTLFSMTAKVRLTENKLAVERHLEPPALGRLQPHATKDRSPVDQDNLGQAHGPVQVVSRHAEFDQGFVLRVDHSTTNSLELHRNNRVA